VSNEHLLELRDVSVDYGAMRALDRVSYVVRPGQMVCLLGGNASGKSTSMKAIFGMVPLAGGEIWWQGERITRWPTERRVAAGLASVPEGRRMFARLTVEENLEVGATLRKDKAAVRSDLDEMYHLFPRLAERRTQLAGTLSGGEQQMLAIARALMSRPRLVCMDEPSMGLAPALVRQVFSLIERIRERQTAVFIVEQNANAALRIADYAYVLRSGRLMLEGAAAEVAQRQEMKEAYLGPEGQRVAPLEEPP
jgi:branched-chain amino acid transport system ATP-binding protein